MSKKNEETVRFMQDGPEYKLSELPPDVLNLLERYNKNKAQRDEFVMNAQESLDDFNRLLDSYAKDGQAGAEKAMNDKKVIKGVK